MRVSSELGSELNSVVTVVGRLKGKATSPRCVCFAMALDMTPDGMSLFCLDLLSAASLGCQRLAIDITRDRKAKPYHLINHIKTVNAVMVMLYCLTNA